MRKGHLSYKVPNVKLRPAPASQASQQRVVAPKPKYLKRKIRGKQEDEQVVVEEETQAAELDEFDAIAQSSRESKPLEGKIVCLTGLRDQRTELQNMARSLGAQVEMALTLDVTHLIAENVLSAKYKVAVDHGIPTMTPSWLTTLHALYLTGEFIDPSLLTSAAHTLKPLHELQIGITAFPVNPPELRASLIQSIIDNGGTYHASFKDTCTHLLVGPEADERSVFSNQKVLRALQFASSGTKLSIVWGEWIEDSIKMHGALEEDRYDIRNPRPSLDRVVGPICSQPSSSPNKLLRQETSTNLNLSTSTGGIKRQRNENGDESEVVGVKKRSRPNASALSDLLGFGANGMDVDELPPVEALVSIQQEAPESQVKESQIKRLASGRSASFAPSKPTKAANNATNDNVFAKTLPAAPLNDTIVDDSGFQTISPQKSQPEAKIFQGAKIWLRGFPPDKAALAAKVCREEEASVFVGSDGIGREDEMDWIVVPMLKETPADVDLEDARVVTEGWIERCLFLNELVDVPSLTFMAKPMPAFPLRDASKYLLAHSGFDECDQNAIGRMCRALGISYSNKLDLGQTTHMITFSEEGRKASRAREAGLPVHGISFLLDLIKQSQKEHQEDAAEQERKREEEESKIEISIDQTREDVSIDQSREKQLDDGPPKPLTGCVVFISQKVSHNRQKIIELVNKLGGRFAHDWKGDVTHLLHSSARDKETFQEFKKARKTKKHICHPRWLDECMTKDYRIDERQYPHTWQQNKQLSYVVAGSQSQAGGSRSQSRSLTPSVSRRSSTESQKQKARAQPGSDDLPPPLEIVPSAPAAPRENILAGLEEMDDLFVPPKAKATERAASTDELPQMEQDLLHNPASTSMPPPTATLEAPLADQSVEPKSSATALGNSPPAAQMEEGHSTETATPGQTKMLTESMLDRCRSLYPTTSSGTSAGKTKKKVRPIDRRRNESITSRPTADPAEGEQLFHQTDARPMRLPFDMSQSQAHRFDDMEEPEESWRITVVDPEAAKARAELLGQVYVAPKGHVLDLSPAVDKRRSSRRA